MTAKDMDEEQDPEIKAIGAVVSALRSLPRDGQQRVLRYAANKLGVSVSLSDNLQTSAPGLKDQDTVQSLSAAPLEGVSPAASKWMQRSGLTQHELSAIFSIGLDQIELVTTTLPGNSKRQRMRNVLLLLGIAAYLGTGAPRVTYDDLRLACQHYDAFDGPNFASHIKSFGAEVGGNKEAGFTLSSRGLISATALIKSMIKAES